MTARRFLPFVFALCALPAALRADVTATILGNTTDSSSAALPHVKVTVTNIETNLTRTTLTDTTGEYRFLSLPVGTYRVEAELSPAERRVAETVRQDFEAATRLTIAELARRAGVSQPSVTRFCRSVGSRSFSEFKRVLSCRETSAYLSAVSWGIAAT